MAQSGQPWETWSYEPYLALTTNTSDTARNAEPAGSRITAPHWQVDLNYTQNVRFSGRYNFQIVGDLFNVANHQTGYNFEPRVPQLRVQHAAELLRPAALPAGGAVPVLIEPSERRALRVYLFTILRRGNRITGRNGVTEVRREPRFVALL